MKSQRRHELQENQLAKVIVGAPSYWQQFSGRALLVGVVVLAIALLIRYRINTSHANVSRATAAVADAREQVGQLQGLAVSRLPAEQLAQQRASVFGNGSSLVEEVARLPVSKQLLAQNQVIKGDLNLAAYDLPEISGAATRPSLKISDNPRDLLTTAGDAYQMVLDKYPDQRRAVIAARFGLATVAEDQHNWDAAKAQYQQIAQIPNLAQAYLDQAKYRLDKLAELREPVFLAEPATMPIASIPAPTTLPVGIAAPTTGASVAMAPATPPASATSQPITPPPPTKSPTSAPRPIPTNAPSH
jgi:hypothetical protein